MNLGNAAIVSYCMYQLFYSKMGIYHTIKELSVFNIRIQENVQFGTSNLHPNTE